MKSQVPRAQKGNIMNTTSSRISVNAINSSIVVSKAFYKKACAYGTNEYTLLHRAMSENPAYQVVIAEAKKQAYSKLTFDRMQDYIMTQPNSRKMLVEFEAAKRVAKSKKALYPLTKRWFLEHYPEYKTNKVESCEEYISQLAIA